MSQGVRRFNDLRAWQACRAYKQAVYAICTDGALSRDWGLRRQLEESVAGPPAHMAEGFGRFNPAEFARYTVIARSSLMESQNHLRDAVDKQYISEAKRQELDALAETALKEVTGLMEYLQSPEALRKCEASQGAKNCVETRAQKIAQVAGSAARPFEPGTANPEQRDQGTRT